MKYIRLHNKLNLKLQEMIYNDPLNWNWAELPSGISNVKSKELENKIHNILSVKLGDYLADRMWMALLKDLKNE